MITPKNTFKYERFSKRLEEIDVDVFHRIPHRYEAETEEIETYFYQTIRKWNTCNLTENYRQFKNEVRNIITLPQLLNEKQRVIDSLIKYIKLKDLLCFQAILDVLVALSRDLQKDFYDYFPEILGILLDILQLKGVSKIDEKEDIVRHIFTAIAYMFKFLWRYIVKDIKTIFDLLLPLLSDSYPPYMSLFAADAFKFVVRKIRDKQSFIVYMFKTLEKCKEAVSGCGALLFEVISGVQDQFHSCAKDMLNLYFDALNNAYLNQELVNDVLVEVVQHITQRINFEKCEILLDTFETYIMKFSEESEKKHDEKRKNTLVYLFRLMNIVIQYREGIMFKQKEGGIIAILNKILKNVDNSEIIVECINVLTVILLAKNICLNDGTPYFIISKILSVDDRNLQLTTIERLIHYSSFELHVLNKFVKHFELDSCVLRLYCKIIKEKKPDFVTSWNSWTKYPLPIDIKNAETKEFFLKELQTLSEEKISENAIRILIIMPHLHNVLSELKATLCKGIKFIYKKLLQCNNDKQYRQLSFAFLLAVDAMSHAEEHNKFIQFINHDCDIDFLDLVKNNTNNICILKAFDVYLNVNDRLNTSSKYINIENLEKLTKFLSVELTSPNQNIRFTVAHIFSFFAHVEGVAAFSNDKDKKKALLLPYMSESIPVTVKTYRDKLLYLRELELQSQTMIDLNPKFYDITLRYLIGNLYLNFSLLWSPISNIISSYAKEQCPQFWSIFYSELTNQNTEEEIDTSLYNCDVVTAVACQVLEYNKSADFQNYKLLLWKCMSLFHKFAESKTRDVAPLFIDFIGTHFSKSTSLVIKSCDIIKEDRSAVDKKDDTVNNEDGQISHEKSEEPKLKYNQFSSGIYKNNMLLAQLQLFGKAENPRMAYREAELYKIFLDLLGSRNSEVQKAALNCILSYKHKYLTPYKENLMNLIDEKTLKNELTRFHIDSDNRIIIDDNHRSGLIPILMRIIYAKMIMRVGMRTGGKGGGQLRRKMILRYLAGCQESEMMIFVQMAFKSYQKYVTFALDSTVDARSAVKQATLSVDLSNVVLPKRLQSTVNLISVFMDEFGGKLSKNILSKLLTLLLCILGETSAMLNMVDQIYEGYLSDIKNLKTSCIGILAKFFTRFESYEWTDSEIDALFEVAVFPWLNKLPIEGIHTPTALLKMFIAWSENPRYFPLFVKHKEGDNTLTPLPYIISLLLNKKSTYSVTSAIMQMFEKLLTLKDYSIEDEEFGMEVEVHAPPLTDVVLNKIDTDCLDGKINYGSAILLPHVLQILNFMKSNIVNSKKNVKRNELVVLSRISELTNDAEVSDSLLDLMIPISVRKASRGVDADVSVDLITTIINLINNVRNPERHLKCVIPLLSTVSAVAPRKLLLNLFNTIAHTTKDDAQKHKLIRDAQVLANLNAYDKRWIEQPDYQRRLDAFDEIRRLIETKDLTLELGAALIHNCFFFLQTDNDLAVRDSSSQCLKSVGVVLAHAFKDTTIERKYLIEEIILSLIRKGIESKQEVVRHASISFLGHMAMECPEVHPVLRDLSLLTNKQDPEVDFFENIIHLQTHRRGRALLKFCSVAETLEKRPKTETLMQFVLPLVSFYLCNEAYLTKHSLVDNAIKAVATVCRLLPWQQYQNVLKFYLDKLRHLDIQKQVIKIICEILDAFHFNLSKSDLSIENIIDKKKNDDVKDEKKEDDEQVMNNENKEPNIINENKEYDEDVDDDDNDKLMGANVEEGDEKDEEEENNNSENQNTFVMQKLLLLPPGKANRLIFDISRILLPQLDRAIIARTDYEKSHKLNRKNKDVKWSREEEELMRVPLALAMIKLLQKLPQRLMIQHLPGIFMKLCSFLKSDMISVRKATREILQNIMTTLGPDYLHYLLHELNTLLTKGFQIHVLSFTTHAVLRTLKSNFQPCHMKENMQSILSVCRIDIFGQTAEEKEVAAITRSVSEAKVTKSFDILNILAEHIDESCMIDLLILVKNALLTANSYKTMDKINRCLQQISLGLSVNKFIQTDNMLKFVYGVVSKKISDLFPNEDFKSDQKSNNKPFKLTDCFIIMPENKNSMGEKSNKKSAKSINFHVLVEFGLRLLELLLNKKEHNGTTVENFRAQLNPFLPSLNICLKSTYVKQCTLALRCLKSIISHKPTLDVVTIDDILPDILITIFDILHKYAVQNLGKGENAVLVATCFKTMYIIMSNCDNLNLSDDQLQSLLVYIEQDLHDKDKFSTAFDLLRKIINLKFNHDEIPKLMVKVRELSIVSESENIKEQSRKVIYAYLKTNFLNDEIIKKTAMKHVEEYIDFYSKQLCYELVPGRMSAFVMIQKIIAKFPENALSAKNNCIVCMFLTLGTRIVNDEDPTCRKLCAESIIQLILRLKPNDRTILFNLIVVNLKDKKLEHRLMAVQICGLFVLAEKEAFESRLQKFLPILVTQFNTDKTKIGSHIKDPERLRQHHRFQILELINKIFTFCNNFFTKEEYAQYIDYFAEQSQELLGDNHLWVRLSAAKLIEYIIASIDITKLEDLFENPDKIADTGFIYSNPVDSLRSLSLDLIAQLMPNVELEFANQVIRNLACIANLIKTVKTKSVGVKEKTALDTEGMDKNNDISLVWLVRRMRRAVNLEVTQSPGSTIVRMSTFQWIAEVLSTVPIEYLKPSLPNLMGPLVREMSTVEESNAPLRQKAKEIANKIKQFMDVNEYNVLLNKAQARLNIRRAERKKIRSQQFVTNPELAAKRKIAKQQKKKEAKKRKIEVRKGKGQKRKSETWKGEYLPKKKAKNEITFDE